MAVFQHLDTHRLQCLRKLVRDFQKFCRVAGFVGKAEFRIQRILRHHVFVVEFHFVIAVDVIGRGYLSKCLTQRNHSIGSGNVGVQAVACI